MVMMVKRRNIDMKRIIGSSSSSGSSCCSSCCSDGMNTSLALAMADWIVPTVIRDIDSESWFILFDYQDTSLHSFCFNTMCIIYNTWLSVSSSRYVQCAGKISLCNDEKREIENGSTYRDTKHQPILDRWVQIQDLINPHSSVYKMSPI